MCILHIRYGVEEGTLEYKLNPSAMTQKAARNFFSLFSDTPNTKTNKLLCYDSISLARATSTNVSPVSLQSSAL